MPFEAFVGVDHQKVGGDADFVRSSTLGEDVPHGRMIVEVGECFVRLPNVTLDVVVELGGCSGKRPEMRFRNLLASGGSEVFHPFAVADTRDVNNAVFFQRSDLFLCYLEFIGCCDARLYTMWKRETGILKAKVIFP